ADRQGTDFPGLLDTARKRLEHAVALLGAQTFDQPRRHRAGARSADPADRFAALLDGGDRYAERSLAVVATNGDVHRLARAFLDVVDPLVPAPNWVVADGNDLVTTLQAR